MTVKKVAKTVDSFNVDNAPGIYREDRVFNFSEFSPMLSPDGRLVLSVPVFKTLAAPFSFEFVKDLEAAGISGGELDTVAEKMFKELDKMILVKMLSEKME